MQLVGKFNLEFFKAYVFLNGNTLVSSDVIRLKNSKTVEEQFRILKLLLFRNV